MLNYFSKYPNHKLKEWVRLDRLALYGMRASLGGYVDSVDAVLAKAKRKNVVARIWQKDPTLWKTEEAHQRIIRNALGWLKVHEEMKAAADDLIAFAEEIRNSREFDTVILCGMGGSSLCPEVLRQTFGSREGYPRFMVLDSTDPDAVADLAQQIDVERSLFIIASKSGTTTEPLAFYKYWYSQVSQRTLDAGSSFLAITDPGTPLVEIATANKFRRIFLNRPDIGGRYSALSYFGLVPAVLMGIDIKRLLSRAAEMAHICTTDSPIQENLGAWLGAILGECARVGRDKLTIVTDGAVSALGLWIEQLIAESTGKEGKGILPVHDEPLGPPAVYSEDRVFVSITVGEPEHKRQNELRDLETGGHLVVHRTLNDIYDLGAEFFLWQFATAFTGWYLGINAFDQPNVQESKDATKELLEYYATKGTLSEQKPLVSDGTLSVYVNQTRINLQSISVLDVLRELLSLIKIGDYIALLVYIEESPDIEEALQTMRIFLRDATKCATTVGYGPRFLHSTGQLHKGGPDTGIFLQLTAADNSDIPIPGEPYTFSILKQAQALGDFRALTFHDRRAIRVDIENYSVAGLKRLQEMITHVLTVEGRTVF